MSFFQKLEKLCAHRGISVAKLAEEVGRGSATATGWRKGAKPQASTLRKIADYFGVPMEYLINDEADDDIEYMGVDISTFNQAIWKQILKNHQFDEQKALKAYRKFEDQSARDAMSDADRLSIYQNNGGVVGVQGHAHASVKVVSDSERVLSEHESELLRIFSELSLIEQSKVLIYASELKEKSTANA